MDIEEKFKQTAVKFLKDELKNSDGDLKAVCSSGRMVGGTGYPTGGIAHISMGSIEGTTSKRPARNITVEFNGEKRKFNIEEIHKLL